MPAKARPATFSIAARDPATGAVGVAVHSKFIAVGAVVPFVSADAGAVATQSYANVRYGPDGLDQLREGHSADVVIERLTAADQDAARRQVGIVGQDGSAAAHTGSECIEYAGDVQGADYTIQGNILAGPEVIEAMELAYLEADGGLPERFLAALHAGNDAGGDSRGEQSAALYIAKEGGGYDGGNDRWIDVRVDDHARPIGELERVFKLYDVTLVRRTEPSVVTSLDGEVAEAVAETLASLGYLDGPTSETFGAPARAALETFRGVNNFENHDLEVLEHALAEGWDEAEGTGESRLIDAIWHGLTTLERA